MTPPAADLREAIHKLETALPGDWWWSVDVTAHKAAAFAYRPGKHISSMPETWAAAPDIAEAIELLAEKVAAL